MRPLPILVRRELWEHPSIYVAPLVVSVFALLTVLIGLTGVGAGGGLKVIIDSAGGLPGMASVLLGLTALAPAFLMIFLAVTLFYLLDTLFAERRERTILFFKSLPVTDTATVVSKALTAMVVSPLITVAVLIATQIAALLLISLFALGADGSSWRGLWQPLPLLQTWLLFIYAGLALAAWYAPFMGWLLLVSAWARKAVFLWAISPILLGLVERIVSGRGWLLGAIQHRATGFFQVAFDQDGLAWAGRLEGVDAKEFPSLLSRFDVLGLADPIGFLGAWQLWAGFLVGLLFAAGAVYLRRYRDES